MLWPLVIINEVRVVALDISKAFDKVWHDGLLWKLEHKFGVSGSLLQWFRSYLTGRQQRVVIISAIRSRVTNQFKLEFPKEAFWVDVRYFFLFILTTSLMLFLAIWMSSLTIVLCILWFCRILVFRLIKRSKASSGQHQC